MNNNVFTAKNTFGGGLISDFAPDNTPATCMTNALNATLITSNGNELSLRNDIGNTKVESAELPSGYIPVGTCEFGGIIYIASCNPETGDSLIGCFPSPERIIGNEGINLFYNIKLEEFITQENNIINTTKIIRQLTKEKLHQGDEYLIRFVDETDNPDKLNYIDYTFGVLDSNLRFVELKNQTDNQYIVYSSPYVSELYVQAKLKVTDIFNVDYVVNVLENKEKEITPIFDLGDLYYNIYDYKIELLTSTYAAPTTQKTIWEGNEILSTNSTFFYKGNSSDVKVFNFVLYVKLDGDYYQLMTKEVIIDLSKIGTGIASVDRWRYYHTDESIKLDFLINGFPKDESDLGNITLTFKECYPQLSNLTSMTIILSPEYYNKQWFLDIQYDQLYDSNIKGSLLKDKVYEVTITQNLDLLSKSYPLYTCPVFNGFWDKEAYDVNKSNIGLIKDYSIITKDHYYQLYGNKIYPLKIEIIASLQQDLIKQDIPDQIVLYPDFIKDDTSDVSMDSVIQIYQEANIKLKLDIQSEFGNTFFNSTQAYKSFNYKSNPYVLTTEDYIKLTDTSYVSATVNYKYINKSVPKYEYKSLASDIPSLSEYGLYINDENKVNYIDGTIPIFYFWSKKVNNRWGIQTNTGIFDGQEGSFNFSNLSKIEDTEVISNVGKKLEYLQLEDLQDFLKNSSNYTIFPAILGATGEMREIETLLNNETLIDKGSSKVNIGEINNEITLLMKDEDDNVIPINYFNKYKIGTVDQLLTLLASIYKLVNVLGNSQENVCDSYDIIKWSVKSATILDWEENVHYINYPNLENFLFNKWNIINTDLVTKYNYNSLNNDLNTIKQWLEKDLYYKITNPIIIKIGDLTSQGTLYLLCNYDGSSINKGLIIREIGNISKQDENINYTYGNINTFVPKLNEENKPVNASYTDAVKGVDSNKNDCYIYNKKCEKILYKFLLNSGEINLQYFTITLGINVDFIYYYTKSLVSEVNELNYNVTNEYWNTFIKENINKINLVLKAKSETSISILNENISIDNNKCTITFNFNAEGIVIDENSYLEVSLNESNFSTLLINNSNGENFNRLLLYISVSNYGYTFLSDVDVLPIGLYLTLNSKDLLCLKASVKNLPTDTYLDIKDPNKAKWYFNSDIRIT